jgi:hypothetical protein
MSNPYQSPSPVEAMVAGSADREQLRRVAKRQQRVLYVLLAQIVIYFLLLSFQAADAMRGILGVAFLVLAVFGIVAVFLLAKEVMHIAIAVICTLLMFVPCISLLVLMVVNGRATKLLQKNGLKVGFMGVNPDTI